MEYIFQHNCRLEAYNYAQKCTPPCMIFQQSLKFLNNNNRSFKEPLWRNASLLSIIPYDICSFKINHESFYEKLLRLEISNFDKSNTTVKVYFSGLGSDKRIILKQPSSQSYAFMYM